MPEQREQPQRSRFQTITRHLKNYKGYLVAGGVCIILTNVLMLTTPYVTKLIFDHLEQGLSQDKLLRLILLLVGLALGAGFFRFLTRRTVIWASRWLEYDLRREVFEHLSRLSPNFYDNTRTGDVMVRLTSDIEAIRRMIGPGIMHITNTFVTVVVAIGFMLYMSPRLTLYSLGPMVIIPIVVNRLGNLIHHRAQRVQEQFSELTATAQENIAGMRVVKAFQQEPSEIEHFRGMSRGYFGLNLDLTKVQALMGPLLMAVSAILTVVVLYVGGRGVMAERIPLGTLVAFFAYLSMLFWPAIALGWVVSLYQRGTASLDRVNSILFSEPAIPIDEDGQHADKVTGKIEFRNLRFKYEDLPVLKDINLTINPGQTVGLVGMTGSGKTTLVSLLARLYPVERGQLFIDGVDINDWDVKTLRKQIGFATQEPFLFSDTVGRNILFGSAGAQLSRVEPVARIAALDKDIDGFPDRYKTMVGERGITLSGGQKQRTAIARALLVDPAILILDDATSSVDTETEAQINERIKEVLTDRTSIIISHRVASIKEADVILYLEDGRIIEQGTHDEMMQLNGRYADLYRSQLIEQELEKL
jgi:ATP-binding cassette subfamily B protein